MSNKEDNDTGKSGIKIVDRRRFDSAGDEKPEGLAEVSESQPKAASSATTKSDQPAPNSQEGSVSDSTQVNRIDQHLEEAMAESKADDNVNSHPVGEDGGDISFSSFVLSLATQALMQLGQLSPPDGMPIQVDPIAAKQSIDILSMLDLKTKGNLDAREANLLKDALHNLRVAYLRFR